MKATAFRAIVAGAALIAAPLGAQTFHKYVSMGDSLAEGEEAGCVVQRHQLKSYSAIIAGQLGIADFELPLVGELPPSNPLTGVPCLGAVISGGAISVGVTSQEGPPLNATLARPYDDLGVNGFFNTKDLVDLKTTDLARSDKDRATARVLRNFIGGPFEGMSQVDEANLLDPDLVTLWIGNNDTLLGAATAAAIDGVTVTPAAVFQDAYSRAMAQLVKDGRTIVVANVPDVTEIPFFTTVPPVVVNPVTSEPVIVGGAPVFVLGPRTTSACPNAPCPVPPGTLVTIQALSLLHQGIGIPQALGGTGLPLPDGSFTPPSTLSPGVLLYPDEVELLVSRTAEYNAAIATIASARGAAVVDINSIFKQIQKDGIDIGGLHLSTDFLAGGIFSADGVHPTNIGYTVLADIFIQAINAATGSGIPRPDYSAVLFAPDVPAFTGTGSSSTNQGRRTTAPAPVSPLAVAGR